MKAGAHRIRPVFREDKLSLDVSRLSGWQQLVLFVRQLRYGRLIWDKLLLRMIISQINAFLLAVPAIMGMRIFDEAFPSRDTGLFLRFVLTWGAAIVVMKVLDFVQESMFVYGIGAVGLEIRRRIFAHVLRLSPRFYESRPVGEHMYRCMYDPNEVSFLVNDVIPRLVSNSQKMITLLFVLGTIKLWLLPACAVYLLLFFLAKHYMATRIRRNDRAERRECQRLDALTREVFSAFKLIKGYDLERMVKRWYGSQLAVRQRFLFRRQALVNFDLAFSNPTIGFAFPALVYLLSFVVGRQMAGGVSGAITIGEYTGIAVLVGQLALPLQDAINLFQEVRWKLVPAERTMETFSVQPAVVDRPDALPLCHPKGRIEVRNVTFAYDGVPVLRDVTLEARPGEKIALVGPIGAGKSTLMKLILRLEEPDAGEILLDGRDIRCFKQRELRQKLGYVPQEAVLFSVTLLENIRLQSRWIPREQVVQAARLSRVDEFAESLPKGLDTLINAGANLSGGQRQRVCLARALAKDPAVLLLDEATSALDPITEGAVVNAVDAVYANRTRIVVAHNVRVASSADRIYVLDGGRIVESGTHATLLAAGGRYCSLWREDAHSADQTSSADSADNPGG